jgi:hypothetical protein
MARGRARVYILTDDRLEDILNKSWTIVAQGLFTLREINQMTWTRQVYISTDDILNKSYPIRYPRLIHAEGTVRAAVSSDTRTQLH